MPHFDTKGIPWGSFGVPRGHLGDALGFSSHFAQARWKLHLQLRAKVSNVSRLRTKVNLVGVTFRANVSNVPRLHTKVNLVGVSF